MRSMVKKSFTKEDMSIGRMTKIELGVRRDHARCGQCFPMLELVITVQSSPASHMSLAIYPAIKIPKKLVGKERYQDSLKASVKDSFYYEIYLRMVSAPRANILMPLLAITIRKIAERPRVKRQAK